MLELHQSKWQSKNKLEVEGLQFFQMRHGKYAGESKKHKLCLGGNLKQSQKLAQLFEVTCLLTEISLILCTEFSVLLGTQILGFASELRSRNILIFFLSCVSLSCSDFKRYIKKCNRKFQINTVTLVLLCFSNSLIWLLAFCISCCVVDCSTVLAKMT